MLEINSVPKENDTVQQMTQSTTGFIVFCIQAVIPLVLSCFPVSAKIFPKGNCTLLCAFPWTRVDSYGDHPNLIPLKKESWIYKCLLSTTNKIPALLPTFCSIKRQESLFVWVFGLIWFGFVCFGLVVWVFFFCNRSPVRGNKHDFF